MGRLIYKQTKADVLNGQKEKKKQRRNFAERKRRYRLSVAFYMLSKKNTCLFKN